MRPDFPKMTSQRSGLRIGGEPLRKSSEIVGKSSENLRKSVGKARRKRSREGWVGEGQKKAGRGG